MNEPWFGARRLWLDELGGKPNVYMALRRVFVVDRPTAGLTLRIAADSDFIAYLDGAEIARGQFSDDPDAPSWSDIAVAGLTAGTHVLAVLVYHKGLACAVYAPGEPGVVFALFNADFRLISDAAARAADAPGFRSGELPLLTPQLGFTAEFDAASPGAADWTAPAFDDAAWPFAKTFALAKTYHARPAAAWPRLGKFVSAERRRSGILIRRHEEKTFVLTMAADQCFWDHTLQRGGLELPERVGDGWTLIYDLGAEYVGFLEFELDAPAGTVIDAAHGEHLDDGHVRYECFGRNFADRFHCRGGRNYFTLPFRRLGARYLEFHIIAPARTDRVEFRLAGLRTWEVERPEPVAFTASENRLTALRRQAIRTLELCMHEHYEDCPWREQALYTYDSRNQMLYGYYLWGNWDYAAAALDLLATAVRPDGHLRLCSPTRMTLVIPVFSTVWALEMAEHYLYSGDDSVWRRHRDQVQFVAAKLLEERDAATGLTVARDPDYWNFFEWAPGLNGHGATPGTVNALYNLYVANMLEAIARMCAWSGDDVSGAPYLRRATALRQTVEARFYDEASGFYATESGGAAGSRLPFNEHTQAMMLRSGAVPPARRTRLIRRLTAPGNGLTPITLSAMPYLAEALLLNNDCGEAARSFVRRKLETDYFPMLDGESSTLWETVKGGDDFVYAGSLCHGWSSLPVYYCGAGLLGVTPQAPGFRRFRVRPWLDAANPEAAGDIPTPAGSIHIECRRRPADGSYELKVIHPAALQPEVAMFEGVATARLELESY